MSNYAEYSLMNKDHEIMKFISETNEYGEVLLDEIDETEKDLPIGFEDIHSFIAHRQAPKHRKHVFELMKQSGCDDLDGFMNITHALSLNDTFWVKTSDSHLKWEDVSLYQNDFNEMIAQCAFEGGVYDGFLSSTSPEFGTDGTYAKCWLREGKQISLLKTGSDQEGIEPFSEFYASQLSQILCKDSVRYSIGTYHNHLVSKCPLFTSEKEGYLKAAKCIDFKQHNQVSYLLDFFAKLGFEDEFRRMLVLDALIVNVDRHAGNYGFIVDNDSQKIKRMAPVFDHNRSLLYSFHKKDFSKLRDYLRLQVPRIGGDFNVTAHSVLTPEIRTDLLNLKGFSFERNSDIRLPEERLQLLERMIDTQIENILESRTLYFFKEKKVSIHDKIAAASSVRGVGNKTYKAMENKKDIKERS